MSVIVRFAPSPTGDLHIGSARTALFNWLYARNMQGKMLLRIEDTDRERSSQQAIDVILNSLSWLGVTWDDDPIYQFSRAQRHVTVAQEMLASGHAYYCYCTPDELDAMREEARSQGLPPRYDGRWRNRSAEEAPAGIKPVIRFKAPQTGETQIYDSVQGTVTLDNQQLDDLILLRSDGTPTYNLAVVVDDHDMEVTHVIRGDDHLTNTFRQYHLFKAMGWDVPQYAHIPLIHGEDGAKLSKRHGALSVEAYRDMGILPETLFNYLLRLGWSHGDDEIISISQAIEWFTVTNIGKSPARLDMQKLLHLNGHYIRLADNQRLVDLILPLLQEKFNLSPSDHEYRLLLAGMNGLKQRAKTLIELAELSIFYVHPLPLPMDEKLLSLLTDEGKSYLVFLEKFLASFPIERWSEKQLETYLREISEEKSIKLGALAQPIRVALTGKSISPSVFEIMSVLGKEETLKRFKEVVN